MDEQAEGNHWEGDLIIGARNGSDVLTIIERVSRYTLLIDLPEGYRAEAVSGAFVDAFFGANAAWLGLNVMAHNMARFTSRIGLGESPHRLRHAPATLPANP